MRGLGAVRSRHATALHDTTKVPLSRYSCLLGVKLPPPPLPPLPNVAASEPSEPSEPADLASLLTPAFALARLTRLSSLNSLTLPPVQDRSSAADVRNEPSKANRQSQPTGKG